MISKSSTGGLIHPCNMFKIEIWPDCANHWLVFLWISLTAAVENSYNQIANFPPPTDIC